MNVIMKNGATEEQKETVIEKIKSKGLEPLVTEGIDKVVIGVGGDTSRYDENDFYAAGVERIRRISRSYKQVSREFQSKDTVIDINGVKIGGDNYPVVIAGPCAVEEYKEKEGPEWMTEIAQAIKKAGADILRGGAYKSRSNPYSFQGLEEKGLQYLAETERITGMPVVSEATGETQISIVSKYVKVIQIGTRNAKSYEMLKRAGKETNSSGNAILLKRGESATLKEFLNCAEYLSYEGCNNIMLCLRGIRTFENKDNGFKRYTADLADIPILKKESHLPVIFDPSHSSGDREYVKNLSLAAVALGANGLMIETHPDPDNAWCDAKQQITPNTLSEIVKSVKTFYSSSKQYVSIAKNAGLPEMRQGINQIDNKIIEMLSERNKLVSKVAEYKKEEGLSIHHPKREKELLEGKMKLAKELGVDSGAVERIFNIIIEDSRRYQHDIIRK